MRSSFQAGAAGLLARAALGLVALVASDARAGTPEPEVGRLRAHIATLASPEYAGRRGPGGQKAEAYVERELRGLGLAPLFGDSYTQDIPDRESGRLLGRNVGATLVGSDPKLRDEWLIVAAHYDHLGINNGALYPGADDNASGVALMLEAARCLARSDERPRRSVVFIGFDLEEAGLWGSRYFVEHMPVPLDRVKLFVTADMIGRSLGGVCPSYVFLVGTEHAPGLRPWIDEAAKNCEGLDLGLVGADLLAVDRSDYGPFRAREVPYLFFSTGENPCYHRPTDTADTIDYAKAESISRLAVAILRRAVAADALPPWVDQAEPDPREAVVLRDVLRRLLDHRDELGIKPGMAVLMSSTVRTLDRQIPRGPLSPAERARLIRVAQLVLFSVL